jgi:hypothetical protein
MLRVVFLLLGTALLVFLLRRLGPSEILHVLGQIGWHSIPILLLYAAYQATRALALRACVLQTTLLRYGDALAIRFSGEAVQSLTFTGPLLAEPTKAWLLERNGLTLKEGFAATITEYQICTFVTAGMSIAGLLYVVRQFEPVPVVSGVATAVAYGMVAFLIAAAIAIVRRFYLIGTVITGLARIGVLRGRLRPDMAWINRMEDLLLAVLRDRPGRFAAIALIEAAAQAFLILEVVVVLHALELAAPQSYPFVIEAVTKFISVAFLFIPMQMGVAEGTYAVIFDTLGLPAAAGFTLAFVRRARSLLVAGIGLTMLGLLSRDRPPVH